MIPSRIERTIFVSRKPDGIREEASYTLFCDRSERDTALRREYSHTNITVVDNLPGEIIFIAKQMKAG